MSFDLQHILEASTPQTLFILILLLVMGVAALYVAIERLVTLGKARGQSRAVAEALAQPMKKGDVAAGIKVCKDPAYKNAYLGHLMGAGLGELADGLNADSVAAARRAIERRNTQEALDMRRGMNILATVGSTAPFVGLVGTIFGIINAFSAMAEAGGGGLAQVSAGIAEALIATAVGIFVAIIGVWLFNFFTARIETIDNDISVSVGEFVDWCEKRLSASNLSDDPTETLAQKAK